jgi:4-aminobutyrate aminotransferase-like enzyme
MADTIQKYKHYVMTGLLKPAAPIVIDRASGAAVTDVHGREYLDCFGGISVVDTGHCNPQVVAAAKAQMEKLVHCSSYLYRVQPVADLALQEVAQPAHATA